jgi:hypothetical protein
MSRSTAKATGKKRFVIGFGLLAAGVTMLRCATHCRRAMSEHAGAATWRLSEACRTGGGAARRGGTQGHESTAPAA